MNTNLRELYQDLRERQSLPPDTLRHGMRIGVIYPDSVNLITVAVVGPGRLESYQHGQQLVAVARISPGQPAIKWEQDGTVHLLKLVETYDCMGYRNLVTSGDLLMLDFPGCSADELLSPKLGVLWKYSKAIWEPVGELPAVPVTKEEKNAVWKQTPLEKLVDDNTNGIVTAQNKWFYQR